MNKKIGIPVIIFLIILIGLAIYIFVQHSNNENSQSNYESNRTSTSENTNTTNQAETQNTTNTTPPPENTNSQNQQQPNNTNNTTPAPTQPSTTPVIETQLSTFSTNIYSQDSARQNNIQITCKKLNGTIVKNGATFSFCNTIGPSTSSKGYQEADIYDNNGKKKKGFGGGNCQISSTLYNAVLATPNLTVIERHPHSNKVPYVKKDKDAAVAYGSYDFKFRNDTGKDVKILASATNKLVTITLNSL